MEEFVVPRYTSHTRCPSIDNEITRRGYTAIGYQPTSLDLVRAESITQLQSENGYFSSKPNYEITSVLEGREDVNSSVDPEPLSALSTTPHATEHLDLDGPGVQDSDEIDHDEIDHDTDLSSLTSSLRSNDGLFTSQLSVNEECESVGEVTCDSVEAVHQEDDEERHIVTGSPEQCQEIGNEISQHVVCDVSQKTALIVEEFSPVKPKEEQHYATVCYVSMQWEGEFPLGETVSVKNDEDQYFTVNTNGHVVTLNIKKVSFLSKKLFKKWQQFGNSNQLDTIVAYLEDQDGGYLIREHFDHDLAEAVNKITKPWGVVTSELADLDKLPSSKQRSASYMSNWEKKSNEKRKLAKCLSNLITSMIKAVEDLHQCHRVSLNIRVSNFFVRTSCHCWGTAACVHDGSGMTAVIIRGSGLTHSVGSVVTAHPDSKAFQLIDPLHNYKTAAVVYDKLDLVFTVIKVLAKFSGRMNCKEMMKKWMSSVVDVPMPTEPIVAQIRRLLIKCDINDQSIVQKLTNYLEMSAVHYEHLKWEHEV